MMTGNRIFVFGVLFDFMCGMARDRPAPYGALVVRGMARDRPAPYGEGEVIVRATVNG